MVSISEFSIILSIVFFGLSVMVAVWIFRIKNDLCCVKYLLKQESLKREQLQSELITPKTGAEKTPIVSEVEAHVEAHVKKHCCPISWF